jgi:leader peptidase (prepilin peptidase)/N-methyltransferase
MNELLTFGEIGQSIEEMSENAMIWVAGVYGMVFGSFFTLLGLRLPRGESIVLPPSHCDACQRRLSWYELIPVFSWIGLRGRCRTCGVLVPMTYPMMELLCGAAFFLAALQWHWGLGFWIAAWSAVGFVAIAMTDVDQHRIPDAFLIPLTVGLLAFRLFDHPLPIWDYVLGGLAGMGLLWSIRAVSRGGMGLGDVKMFGYVGLLVGISGMVLTLVLAACLGVLAGIGLWFSRRMPSDHRVPFGPAIALAAMMVYLYGSGFLAQYWAIR